MKKQSGFTLIELLVVIAIIGLLSTVAVVALNSARLKARDAKRIADIKQIQTALELYYNDANGYPSSVTPGTGEIKLGTVTYMAVVPKNPTPVDQAGGCTISEYTYAAEGSAPYTSYKLRYCLGGATGGLGIGPHTATPSGNQ